MRGLPEFAGELPVATLADEIRTPGEGQVRALLTLSGNPVSSTPDGAGLAEAIRSLDFVAAVDFYVNETTRLADVILPPTGALERDHYDLVFHTLAVRNTARFTPALFEKPRAPCTTGRSTARSCCARSGCSTSRKPRKARLVQAARMRVSPTRTIDLLLRTSTPRLSVRRLRRGPVDLGPLQPCLPERLQTEDRRIHAAPQQVLDDVARLDAVTIAPEGLLLVGRRHQRDNNSWMHNTPRLTKGKARHQLYMHPADLAERAITDGSLVRVASAVGTVEVEVQASDDMMPGVVSLPHGYGHRRPGVRMRQAVELPGASMNDLTDPASAGRQRQRGAVRRAGDGHAGRLTSPLSTARTASRAAIGSTAASATSAACSQTSIDTAASCAPTGRTAASAIDSDEMPMPTRAVASIGSAAASPQTPTGLPACLPGLGGDRDQLEHRRLPGVGEVREVGGHPVGGHRVLGQVVGADRQEVDDLEHLRREQRGARDLHHHARLEPVGADLPGELRRLRDGRHHRRHHPRLGAGALGRGGDAGELALQEAGVAERQPQPADTERGVLLALVGGEGDRLVRPGVEGAHHDVAVVAEGASTSL